jgi:hypothetical protein
MYTPFKVTVARKTDATFKSYFESLLQSVQAMDLSYQYTWYNHNPQGYNPIHPDTGSTRRSQIIGDDFRTRSQRAFTHGLRCKPFSMAFLASNLPPTSHLDSMYWYMM